MFSCDKRITILVGHFGSGKTEIALQLAMSAGPREGVRSLVDLDIVKPYFRSRGASEVLAAAGIRLIAPSGENRYADLPMIIPQIRGACSDRSHRIVMDAGGDDTGARVVGSLADVLRVEETETLLVLNFKRPLTPTVEAALERVAGIERAARRKVTGIVSNTHLMDETTREIVVDGYAKAKETASGLKVPLVAVVVDERLPDRPAQETFDVPLVVIRRVIHTPFERPATRKTGPLFVVT